MWEEVDRTIVKLCDCIQREAEAPNIREEENWLPEMTKALAELISASTNLRMSTRMYESSNVIQNH